MKSTLFVFGLFLTISASGQANEGDFHLDKDYAIKPTGIIKLRASDAKVHITGTNRKNVHVTIDREVTTKGITFGHDEFAVDISEENGDLNIRERSNSVSVGIVGYHYEKYTIIIEAPETTSLIVKGDDGDYWIRNIDGAIAVDVDDADIELSQCSGDKFEFRLDDGDIKMDEGRGSLAINGDDSDIEIKNASFTSIDADVDDGDLKIETSLTDTGSYYINAEDGLVILTVTKGGGTFDIRHGDGRVFTDSAFNKVEDSEDRTKLMLASGSAKVEIRSDDARVRLAKR